MTGIINKVARKFYAETYDTVMEDWEGEIEFYQDLAAKFVKPGQALLELACGTGRIALRLAENGYRVVGLDNSPDMVRVFREKSQGMDQARCIESDLREFQQEEGFPLIIIPAHSFQNLTDVADHVSAFQAISDHLLPDGRFVIHLDHLDFEWLAGLVTKGEQTYQGEPFIHPTLGSEVKSSFTWSYEPFTQTASSEKIWEIIGKDGKVDEFLESGRLSFHCFFPAEMEHLFARCGFEVEHLYGDFSLNNLKPESTEMIWVAKKQMIKE